MTIYSKAANTYADKYHGDSDPSNWYYGRDSVRAFVRAAFDAGAANAPAASRPLVAWERELLGVAPEPELIEYTDPRVLSGAQIRLVREYTLIGEHDSYDPEKGQLRAGFIAGGYAKRHKIYLLSEAPNPDTAVLEAMMKADCFREEWDVYVSRLEFMRKAGIKVELAP